MELSSTTNDERETGDPEERVHVDDILNDIGCGPFQVMAFFLAGLSAFSYGGTATVLGFVSIPVTKLWHLSALTYSFAIATTSFMNMVGSTLFGFLSYRFGRVWPFALCKFIVGLLSIAASFSPSFPVFVLLRGLASIGTGGAQALTYPTLVEFLPVKNRGRSILLMMMFALGGCLIAGLAWWLIPTYENGWRYLVLASGIPALISSAYRVVFYFQSPRFLISKGDTAGAWNVFKAMAKVNRKTLDDTNKERIEVTKLGEEDRDNMCKKCMFLFKPPLLRQSIIVVLVILIARYCFYSTLIFLPVFLENLDVHVTIYFSLMFACVAQIPGMLFMSIVTDWPWFGRLNTMRLYSLAAAVLYFFFAFIRNQIATPVFIVIIFFTMSPLVSMSYTYASEVYPTEVRSIALGTFVSIQGMIGTGMRVLTGYIIDRSRTIPWLFPLIWGVLYLVIFFISFGLTKEPQGKKLEDVLKR